MSFMPSFFKKVFNSLWTTKENQILRNFFLKLSYLNHRFSQVAKYSRILKFFYVPIWPIAKFGWFFLPLVTNVATSQNWKSNNRYSCFILWGPNLGNWWWRNPVNFIKQSTQQRGKRKNKQKTPKSKCKNSKGVRNGQMNKLCSKAPTSCKNHIGEGKGRETWKCSKPKECTYNYQRRATNGLR